MVVIFKNELNPGADGSEYRAAAARMWELGTRMPGFVSFKSYTADDGEQISIITFESEEALDAWRTHPEHVKIQERAREIFYNRYWARVCRVVREYEFSRDDGRSSRPEGR